MDNEFLLQDRIQKIQQIVTEYGRKNFSISYSGGKDSNVLSVLVDLALPGNKIPRVFVDTGIELNAVRDFVKQKCEEDSRFQIIKPAVPIKQMLNTVGYPFKSKAHSQQLERYQRHNGDFENNAMESVKNYIGQGKTWSRQKMCPKMLMYQFTPEFSQTLKVSPKCCDRLKKDPLHLWQRMNCRPYSMIGLTLDEGGQRESAQCLVFKYGKLKAFQPLVAVNKDWENWFIDKYDIKLPAVYYPPYNFERTGCKGCPFNIKLQDNLDALEKYSPAERKQCEAIWKPVYDEYRRIGYRLKK